MKNICIISGGIFPVPAVKGGAVEELATALLNYNETEESFKLHIVTIFDKDLKGKVEKNGRIHPVKVPNWASMLDKLTYFYRDVLKHDWRAMFFRKKFSSKVYAKAVEKHLKENFYDLVVVENNMSLLPAVKAGMGEARFKNACIYHAHSVLIDNPDSILYLKSCYKIMTVSDYVKDALSKEPELKNQTFVMVSNGVSTKQFNAEEGRKHRQDWRNKFHIADDKFVFLYSGRISIEKGVSELVDAFASLHCDNAVLAIVGSSFSGDLGRGQYEKMVRKKCEKGKLSVHFLGYIPHSEIHEAYAMADCLVIPSIVEEAGPLTALEGAIMGIPLIAQEKGAIREYLGDYAMYYKSEAYKTELPELMQRIYDNPGEFVRENNCGDYFSTEAYYRRFKEAIQECL